MLSYMATKPRPTVVIADDHERMRQLVRRILSQDLVVLEAVSDGEALLEAAKELNPDLFVVDINMPRLNGLEALRQLRELGNTTPVIILTSSEDSAFLERALQIGANGFVIKSRLGYDLVRATREALAGRTFTSPLSAQ